MEDMADPMLTSLLLRQRLEEVVLGETSMVEFDAWLTGAAWDERDVAPDTRQLAAHVGLLIDEYTSGAWTLPELKSRLLAAASTAVVSWGGAVPSPVTTGATSMIILETALVG